ncbi:MAG: DNA/RNA non-specific endonuclease [Saprospiraceae bacterium]
MKRFIHTIVRYGVLNAIFWMLFVQGVQAQNPPEPYNISTYLAEQGVPIDDINGLSIQTCGRWMAASYGSGPTNHAFAVSFNAANEATAFYDLGSGFVKNISCEGHVAIISSDGIGRVALYAGGSYFSKLINVPLGALPQEVRDHPDNPLQIPGLVTSVVGPAFPDPRVVTRTLVRRPSWKSYRELKAYTNETTSMIGRFVFDTRDILEELGNPNTEPDFGPRPGDFNLLNVTDTMIEPEYFWTNYNVPWLEAAVSRGDEVTVLTNPNDSSNVFIYDSIAMQYTEMRTFFGRELRFMDSVATSGSYLWVASEGKYIPNTQASNPAAGFFTITINVPLYQTAPDLTVPLPFFNINIPQGNFREYSPSRAFMMNFKPVVDNNNQILDLIPTEANTTEPRHVIPVGFPLTFILNGISEASQTDGTTAIGSSNMEGVGRFDRLKGFYAAGDDISAESGTTINAYQVFPVSSPPGFFAGNVEVIPNDGLRPFVMKFVDTNVNVTCDDEYEPNLYYRYALPLELRSGLLRSMNAEGWASGVGFLQGSTDGRARGWIWNWCTLGCNFQDGGSRLFNLSELWKRTYDITDNDYNYTITSAYGYSNGIAVVKGTHNATGKDRYFRYSPVIPLESELCPCLSRLEDFEVKQNRPKEWNSRNPINFNTTFLQNAPPADLRWFVTDKKTGIRNEITNPTQYYFNLNGRDEWGAVVISAGFRNGDEELFICKEIKLEILDYGIYFLDATGKGHKLSPDDTNGNPNFNPSKPTVIYVHGLNDNSVKNHKRENLTTEDGTPLSAKWIAEGWNVGAFYWNQYADVRVIGVENWNVVSVLDAEKTIYFEGEASLRWRRENGTVTTNAVEFKGVNELFADACTYLKSVLNPDSEVRMAGHSLGAQVILTGSEMLPLPNRPKRIALLDPWWSSERSLGLSAATHNISNPDLALEWYTSTKLQEGTLIAQNFAEQIPILLQAGGCGQNPACWADVLVGFTEELQETLEESASVNAMRDSMVFIELAPRYTSVIDFLDLGTIFTSINEQHRAAVNIYFNSIDETQPIRVYTQSFEELLSGEYDYVHDTEPQVKFLGEDEMMVNASSCFEEVKGRQGQAAIQVGGTYTLTTEDDLMFVIRNIHNPDFNTLSGRDYSDLVERTEDEEKNKTLNVLPPSGQADHLVFKRPTLDFTAGMLKDSLHMIDQILKMSFNNDRKTPNWVAFRTGPGDIGPYTRGQVNDPFAVDPDLPAGFDRILPFTINPKRNSFNKYSASNCLIYEFDRGHFMPSSYANGSLDRMRLTYYMSNMAPQNPSLNRRLWSKLENHIYKKVKNDGSEVYNYTGISGIGGRTELNYTPVDYNSIEVATGMGGLANVKVPAAFWKVAVILPDMDGDDIARLADAEILAIWIDNYPVQQLYNGQIGEQRWRQYLITVQELETRLNAMTSENNGLVYDFFRDITTAVGDPLSPAFVDWMKNYQFEGSNPPPPPLTTLAINSPDTNPTLVSGDNTGSAALIGKLYPNPTGDGRVTLEFDRSFMQAQENWQAGVNIVVKDLLGRLYFEQQIPSDAVTGRLELDFELETPGIYTIEINTDRLSQTIRLLFMQ